jgi:DNA invertase Pin-like site-specific DNA recombinase
MTARKPHLHVYIRWSSDSQEKGDSRRRQTKMAEDFQPRHPEFVVDWSRKMVDEGKSAFDGTNRFDPNSHLYRFLADVDAGLIPKGDGLLVEKLDRLSRQDLDESMPFFQELLRKGYIVQVMDPEKLYAGKLGFADFMHLSFQVWANYEDSQKKAGRVGDAWANLKKEARNNKRVITRRVPAWCRVEGDKEKIVVHGPSAKVVQMIYRWAREGYGIYAIYRRLHAEKIPPITSAIKKKKIGKVIPPRWTVRYIHNILTARTVLGEYQPRRVRKRGHQPEGDPIPGYYPAIITPDEFDAARGARLSRRNRGAVWAKARAWSGRA